MLEIKTTDSISIIQVENTSGYDGHCLRTYNYWKDQMPDIVDTVESINSIAVKYPALRSKSKAPSFA